MARYISKAKRGPKKSKVIIFLNVVIGLLAAFCIFMLIGFFTTDNDHYYDRGFDAYYISYTIDKGDYAQLLGDYYRDYGILGMVESGSRDMRMLRSVITVMCRPGTVSGPLCRRRGWMRRQRKSASMSRSWPK